MRSKNSWNKEYEKHSAIKEEKDFKDRKVTRKRSEMVLSKHGLKPSVMEQKFTEHVSHMTTEKPKLNTKKEKKEE